MTPEGASNSCAYPANLSGSCLGDNPLTLARVPLISLHEVLTVEKILATTQDAGRFGCNGILLLHGMPLSFIEPTVLRLSLHMVKYILLS